MTIEEAIKILEQVRMCYLGGIVEAINMAIDALKMQEPVEPKLDVDILRYGNCGRKLEHQELLGDNVLFHEQYRFCPECGQAVKWE